MNLIDSLKKENDKLKKEIISLEQELVKDTKNSEALFKEKVQIKNVVADLIKNIDNLKNNK